MHNLLFRGYHSTSLINFLLSYSPQHLLFKCTGNLFLEPHIFKQLNIKFSAEKQWETLEKDLAIQLPFALFVTIHFGRSR